MLTSLAGESGYTHRGQEPETPEFQQEADTLRIEVAFLGPEVCQLIFGQK
jgi:hypothetical protein